jgi:tripartite-type tricarboxylate transporter receptor subunit TctC
MKFPRRQFLRLAAASAALPLVSPAATAQTYPDRLIKIIAPFPPGGLVDVLARALGDEMSKSLGKPVIVENKPGAGGDIGADIVAKATPDGYTLLMTSPGIQSINQFLYKSMPFDPDKAFAPISMVAEMSMVVVVHPKTGITTLKQLVDFAHAHPGKLTFGSAGIGTTGHLGLELLTCAGQMKFTHVPYKNGSLHHRPDWRPDRWCGRQSTHGLGAHKGRYDHRACRCRKTTAGRAAERSASR